MLKKPGKSKSIKVRVRYNQVSFRPNDSTLAALEKISKLEDRSIASVARGIVIDGIEPALIKAKARARAVAA